MKEARLDTSQERLAFFVSSMRGGGAERVMLNLVQGMAKHNYVVDLVLARAEGPYLTEVPERVRVVDLGASRVLTSLPALFRYLRQERPRAMLSAMNYVNIVALWVRRIAGVSTRVVISEHVTLSRSTRHASSRRGKMLPHFVKHFYPWADGIVAVSKGVADDLAQVTGLPRERIQVIYNPIVTSELRAKAQRPLDHAWFKSGQSPVFLAVGRLTVEKDFPTLIQAFAKVRQAHQVRLLILGEGEERSSLEALVRQLGLEADVSLPGFVENPYAYMARANLFVLSSQWEALPTVLIEALYCGAPLISTDCPSGPREILADGLYGRLVPVGDVDAMARAMANTLASEPSGPPPESWKPFELEPAVNQYLSILLGK